MSCTGGLRGGSGCDCRPTWLDLAHRKLDAAVLEAYGWLNGLVDEEVRNGLVAEPYGTHEKG
jgi:hypothetical protein